MKILVTGATGFIGNHLVKQLLDRGHEVIATSSNVEKAKTFPWYTWVKYIPFDFNDFDNSINYFEKFGEPEAIIHLAWEGLPNYKDAFHLELNLPRHFALLENLVDHGLKNITVTGTCFEYGMQEGCLTETMTAKPSNPYAIAKNKLREMLEQLQSETPFHFKWIRLFYMYGKGQNSKSLISQLEAAINKGDASFDMSGGEQVRDFLPVEKVAEYIADISLQDKVNGIINCCSGKPEMVKDFVQEYLKERGKTIQLNLGVYPYTDYEPMRFWGDNNKLKSIEQ